MSKLPGIEAAVVGNNLVLHCQPHPDRREIQADVLKSLIEQAGASTWWVDPVALGNIVHRCNTEQQAFEAILAERRDAQFELEVARDGMSASMWVTQPYGGGLLNIDDVVQALAGVGVVFGLDEAALLRICAECKPGRYTVAKGLQPVHGENSRFEVVANLTRDRTPKIDENGLIDFRELGEIPVVDVGQPLMRRIPATPGKQGRNILAGILQPIPGRDEPFDKDLIGAGVLPDDPNLLQALVRGQPVQISGSGIMVEQIIQFDGASMKSGNIAFDGTVHINGDVLQGMKVTASGDIIVTGTVDGGILEAGGSIQVQGGVIAHAKVKAGLEVCVRFVENSKIDAGRAIAVNDMSLQSELQAGNQVLVGRKAAKRGRLVGGVARATVRVAAPILGDPASPVTQIVVGVNPVLESTHKDLVRLMEKHEQEEASLTKLVEHLRKQVPRSDTLDKAEATLGQMKAAKAELLERRKDLDQQLEWSNKARVDVGVGIFGPVDLAFGHMERNLRRTYERGSFSVQGRLVLFTPDEGESSEV